MSENFEMFGTSDFGVALEEGARAPYEDAALYDHEYRRRRDDVRWYRSLAKQVAAESAKKPTPVEIPGATRILELGCGSGRLLIPLARDGHTVVGVDRSSAMLQRCQTRLERLNARARARVHIIEGDFRELPATLGLGEPTPLAGEGRKFPLVLCPFNGFMHLYTREDVERCLAEVRRCLSPGGLFAFDITHPDPTWLARDPTRRFARTRFRHPTSGERMIYSTSHIYDPATQIAWIRFHYDRDLAPLPSKAASGNEPDRKAERSPNRRPDRKNDRQPDGKPDGKNDLEDGSSSVLLAHRLFFPAEIDALLHYNGFAVVYHAGGFQDALDGTPLCPVSAEQVICARVR